MDTKYEPTVLISIPMNYITGKKKHKDTLFTLGFIKMKLAHQVLLYHPIPVYSSSGKVVKN